MKSRDEVKVSATKLRALLHDQGIELKHSEALEAVSKLEGYADWNTHTAYISRREQCAEQYLDEMLDGHRELNYTKITKHLRADELGDFTEKEFLRIHTDLNEDLGSFVSRDYLGAISGESNGDSEERFPEGVRHVWRGSFEHHEVFIHVGICAENGRYCVVEAEFR